MTGMDELGPETRALLDAARAGLSPDPAAVQRVHARIHAATAGAAAGTALGVKLGLVGLVAAIAIGAGVYVGRGSSVAPAPAPDLLLATPTEQPRPAAHEAPQVSDDDLITIETPAAGSRDGSDPRPPRARAAGRVDSHRPTAAIASSPAAGSAHGATPAAGTNGAALAAAGSTAAGGTVARGAGPGGIELGREVQLIDLAMAALRRGDAGGALRVIHQYAAEAGDAGQLRQDAAAIEIEALCKLRDPAVRDKLAAFDARFPHSAQRATCSADLRAP